MIDEYYRIWSIFVKFLYYLSKFVKIIRFHFKISNELHTSQKVNEVRFFDIFWKNFKILIGVSFVSIKIQGLLFMSLWKLYSFWSAKRFWYRWLRLINWYLTDKHEAEMLALCFNNRYTDFAIYVFGDKTTIRQNELLRYQLRKHSSHPCWFKGGDIFFQLRKKIYELPAFSYR